MKCQILFSRKKEQDFTQQSVKYVFQVGSCSDVRISVAAIFLAFKTVWVLFIFMQLFQNFDGTLDNLIGSWVKRDKP